MARRSGRLRSLAQAQREAQRREAARGRAQAAEQRGADRAQAAYKRAAAADEKERHRLYAESRAAEVGARNEVLQARISELDNLLSATLCRQHVLDLDSLRRPAQLPTFRPGPLAVAARSPQAEEFLPIKPGVFEKLFAADRYDDQLRQGQSRYAQAVATYEESERRRLHALAAAQFSHTQAVEAAHQETRAQDAEVDALKADLLAGRPEAVTAYLDLVLQASPVPEGFPHQWRLAYVPESEQLVVEYELPTRDVVPTVKAYRYVKASDSVTETARAAGQIKAQYASVVTQTSLRLVHEVFAADRLSQVGTVVFNGMVSTTDPATGRRVRPCLLTVRATRDAFEQLDLAHVEPAACLRYLGAGVSRSPAELLPVRPVLEFDMVDPRFVQESDVLAGLDQRPNLLELTPNEFESLIQNLFTRMGLEAKQTQASRDGGVDCVAYDPRPIMGGKVVIQAKRYKNTVGVSAVRDLYGTLQNEGASKGILVTTSGYGQASHEFAKNKPIELLDGANLLHLLREHAGIEARIVVPEDWRDPVADSAGFGESIIAVDARGRESVVGLEPEASADRSADRGQALPQEPVAEVALRPGEVQPLGGAGLLLRLQWQSPSHDVDLTALLLAANGKVRNDADMIFFNHQVSVDGTVRCLGPSGGSSPDQVLRVDLPGLADDVHRVVVVASVTQGRLQVVTGLRLIVEPDGGGAPRVFRLQPELETALLCAELYRRGDQWRLRALGDGYADGLAGLARDYGVEVA